MPKLYSGQEIIKTLKRAGFYVVSQKGSHQASMTKNEIEKFVK